MTKDAMRTLVRNLFKETSTAVGALYPSDNVLIDLVLDMSMTLVCMDLAVFLPHEFLTSETISLLANTASYTLTGSPLQYWAMLRNITGETPRPIRWIDPGLVATRMTVGEKHENPNRWYHTGEKTITFVPTPSVAKANYAKILYISAEAATMGTNGPAYIPTPLHSLVPLKAVELTCSITETNPISFQRIYAMFINQGIRLYGPRVQNEPKFLNPDPAELEYLDSRDKAFIDMASPFER